MLKHSRIPRMSSNCPVAPAAYDPDLEVVTTRLPSGTLLYRFHKTIYAADSFNPNTGRRIDLPDDGARFNPFPGAPLANVPTLYAANSLSAAALESVFHDVEHIALPTFPRMRLLEWSYSRLKTTRELVLFELVNPRLRQLAVAGRKSSLTESEIVHTATSEYPNTRTWARFLHDSIPALDGLMWRPRLGGKGIAFVFFGDRLGSGAIKVHSKAISVAAGPGFGKIQRIARSASISIIRP